MALRFGGYAKPRMLGTRAVGGAAPGMLDRPRCYVDTAEALASEAVRIEARRAYAWEDAVVGTLQHEQPLSEEAAQRLIDRIWPRIASNFPRRMAGPPLVMVSTSLTPRISAEYDPVRHEIRSHPELLRRYTLIHELGHAFADGGHGPQFCRALMLLWQHAFNIAPWHAMRLAAEHGLAI